MTLTLEGNSIIPLTSASFPQESPYVSQHWGKKEPIRGCSGQVDLTTCNNAYANIASENHIGRRAEQEEDEGM